MPSTPVPSATSSAAKETAAAVRRRLDPVSAISDATSPTIARHGSVHDALSRERKLESLFQVTVPSDCAFSTVVRIDDHLSADSMLASRILWGARPRPSCSHRIMTNMSYAHSSAGAWAGNESRRRRLALLGWAGLPVPLSARR